MEQSKTPSIGGVNSEMDSINEEIHILTKFIKTKYGNHLTKSQINNISKSIGHQIQDSRDLSKIKLNHDAAPFSIYTTSRKDTRRYQ